MRKLTESELTILFIFLIGVVVGIFVGIIAM